MNESFGQCLKRFRRRGDGLSQAALAERIGRVKMTVSQYERDVSAPPQGEVLEDIVKALGLSDEEAVRLRLLASSSRNTLPEDVSDYFFDNPIIYEAIRIAQREHVGSEQWDSFIAEIERRND